MGKELFGTDGIRGVPGAFPLDDATLEHVGLALGKHLQALGRPSRVLIGRDTRESGPHIAECIARGLSSVGVEPISAGVLTTPGVAWLVSREGFAAGVVISASHNPFHDNGVKLISSSGMKFPDAVEAKLEEWILSKNGFSFPPSGMWVSGDEKPARRLFVRVACLDSARRKAGGNENASWTVRTALPVSSRRSSLARWAPW